MNGLPVMDLAGRMTRLRDALDDLDALLVTRLVNIRYLTGFTGSAARLLVGADQSLFVTDGRYRDQATDQLRAAGVDAEIIIGATAADQRAALVRATASAGAHRIGLEADGVTWAEQRTLADAFAGLELVPTDGIVDALRMVKEPGEVARIRAACAIADDALGELLPSLASGPTEREFALRLEFGMRERGASGVSFESIVGSGPNGAQPHARPSDRPIGRGELVVIDFGCIVDGYCSDMTRTVSVGEPSAEARQVWETVARSQAAGCAATVVGADCADVDQASRAVIEAAGWGETFLHGTGHGVGLEIHEAPRVASTATGTLAVGHVVTVEPGVYLPGVGGVRIEDTLVVTPDGPVALTEFPKQLVI